LCLKLHVFPLYFVLLSQLFSSFRYSNIIFVYISYIFWTISGKEKLEPVGHWSSNLRTARPHHSKNIHISFLNVNKYSLHPLVPNISYKLNTPNVRSYKEFLLFPIFLLRRNKTLDRKQKIVKVRKGITNTMASAFIICC
jgi:hypothetical protein